jgi:hypothetical protein
MAAKAILLDTVFVEAQAIGAKDLVREFLELAKGCFSETTTLLCLYIQVLHAFNLIVELAALNFSDPVRAWSSGAAS